MTKHTREKWAERIREWRASGLTAEEFAEGKEYEASSLRWADSQLKDQAGRKERRRRGCVEPSSGSASTPAPRFVPVRVTAQGASGPDVVVEVAGARIRVGRGADLAFVGDVVRALQGGVR